MYIFSFMACPFRCCIRKILEKINSHYKGLKFGLHQSLLHQFVTNMVCMFGIRASFFIPFYGNNHFIIKFIY